MKWWDYSWCPMSGYRQDVLDSTKSVAYSAQKVLKSKTEPEFSRTKLYEKLPDRGIVRVCPNGDPLQECYSDGMITELSLAMSKVSDHLTFTLCTWSLGRLRSALDKRLLRGSVLDRTWIGTSVEDNSTLKLRGGMLSRMQDIPHRYLLLSPLMEDISISKILEGGIGWVIVSSEHVDGIPETRLPWVSRIVMECKSANVPVFVDRLWIDGRLTDDIDLFPPHLRIRQLPWREGELIGNEKSMLGGRVVVGYTHSEGRCDLTVTAPPEAYYRTMEELENLKQSAPRLRGILIQGEKAVGQQALSQTLSKCAWEVRSLVSTGIPIETARRCYPSVDVEFCFSVKERSRLVARDSDTKETKYLFDEVNHIAEEIR